MVRSMYSGVAGMKAHQSKMDTIGNNIANVNTFGFKSSRVTFRDVYYQTMKTASQGTGTRGGTNPTQVGYGAVLGSIDVAHGTSTMQNTGNGLDVAVTGEGFFQVQDSDGNIFYTKAGMMDVDSQGNLVDVNGNFVLGVNGNPLGKAAGSERIQIQVPSVNAANAVADEAINGANFKVSSGKQNSDSNITLTFSPGANLPIGQKAEALITSSGINIRLNPKETFGNPEALNTAVNDAIKAANGGKDHPGGPFTISTTSTTAFKTPLTGAEIAGSNFGVNKGSVPVPTDWNSIFEIDSVGDKFMNRITTPGAATYTVQKTLDASTPLDPSKDSFDITVSVAGGGTYTAKLTRAQMTSPGSVVLKNSAADSDAADNITIKFPAVDSMETALYAAKGVTPPDVPADITWTTPATTETAKASTPSNDIGLGGVPFKLKGGTAGGPQSVKDLTGLAIGSDGIVVANHAVHGLLEVGRIDLANFANPKGLLQSGSTYFTVTGNSGEASRAKPGEDGTGALSAGTLEMSNVDLSNEFADMITTQRGFQANSRLITVSDTMLEELINLKR